MSLINNTSHSQKGRAIKEKRYNLAFSGEIAPGYTIEEVEKNLSSYFDMDMTRVDRIFTDKPFMLKKEVDYRTALTYQIIFEWAGAFCHIEPTSQEPDKNFSGKQHCNVIFDGTIDEKYREEEVKNNLKGLLHLNDRRIEELFSGPAVVIMKDVDYCPALKIQISFELAGAKCRIEESRAESPTETLTSRRSNGIDAQDFSGTMICPKCGFTQKKFHTCRRCGVYVEKFHTPHNVSKAKQSRRPAKKRDRVMKKELFTWGAGLIILGVIQLASLGLWALCITGVGILNLLIPRRPLFILNGMTLFVSGSLNLIFMTISTLFGNDTIGVHAGAGQFELIVVLGGILLVSMAQMYVGIQGVRKFKQYASTK